MGDYSRPPLQLNRGFFEERENQLKLLEIFLGIACAVLNTYCFPNSIWLYCTNRIHSAPQIFSVVVVNVFFIFISLILAFCNLLGISDTFYKYNFPLLEKFITSLAALLYAISSLLILVAVLTSQFAGVWLITLILTLLTFGVYAGDSYRRWKSENYYR